MIIQLETQHLHLMAHLASLDQSEAGLHQINIRVLCWHPSDFLVSAGSG